MKSFLGLGVDLGYLHDMKRRLSRLLKPRHSRERATELSHHGGAGDCNAFITAAEVAKQPDCAALAAEIARRKGRRQIAYVELRSGLKALAF